jgi:hypothetical protein
MAPDGTNDHVVVPQAIVVVHVQVEEFIAILFTQRDRFRDIFVGHQRVPIVNGDAAVFLSDFTYHEQG